MLSSDRLIIFDMDNTLLQSRIDFALMGKEVLHIFRAHGLEAYQRRSVATSILAYSQSTDYDPAIAAIIWQRIAEIEAVGLDQSTLEPGVIEILMDLSQFATLAVLTNNTDRAIGDNLLRLGIGPYLTYVAGRDTVPALKPSPSGMLFIKDRFPDIGFDNTITIGDAIIDAEAARDAGIHFVAYNRSRDEDWASLGIEPLLQLYQWNKQACTSIRELMS